MKRIILSMGMAGSLLLSVQLMAQNVNNSKVPAAVISALKSKFPTASKVSWEKEKGNFEANWGGKSGEDMSVLFTPAGNFVEQVEAISISSLPDGVKDYVKTHYKKANITEAGKVTDAKGATMYEAEVHGKDLVFDSNGKFLKID